MPYKYHPPKNVGTPAQIRAEISNQVRLWNEGAGRTIIPDFDLPMKGDVTDPAQPATVTLSLRGARVPFTVRRWGDFATNLWAVCECIKQMRLSEERGMSETMAQAYKALPAPEGTYETQRDPYEVLELARTAGKPTVDASHRALAGDAMKRNDQQALREINNAKAAIYESHGWGVGAEAAS